MAAKLILLLVIIVCTSSTTLSSELDGLGLRDLAQRRGFLIGGAMRLYPETLSDKEYLKTFDHEFNIVVPEHAMKMAYTHPKKKVYDFSQGDFITNFAESHKLKVRGHTLVWHESNPDWVTKGNYSPLELGKILHEHVSKIAKHFRGHVMSWDVVNEAVNDDGEISKEGPWPKIDENRILGQYVTEAFQWAHKADPKAQLFYNDFGAEVINKKSDGIYHLLKELVQKGIPVNGIGFQMHISYDMDISEDSMRENFARFSQLGLIIQITEMDVGIPKERLGDPLAFIKQAQQYEKVLKVCLQNPACTGLLTWGITDKYSWLDDLTDMTTPLLLDIFYKPKPAYQAVRNLLSAL